MTYLTPDELDAVQSSGLDPFTPYVIEDVSMKPLRTLLPGLNLLIGQYYGGCTYGGREYYYIPTTDELIREDVVRWIMARRKEAQRAAREATEAKQMEML